MALSLSKLPQAMIQHLSCSLCCPTCLSSTSLYAELCTLGNAELNSSQCLPYSLQGCMRSHGQQTNELLYITIQMRLYQNPT